MPKRFYLYFDDAQALCDRFGLRRKFAYELAEMLYIVAAHERDNATTGTDGARAKLAELLGGN